MKRIVAAALMTLSTMTFAQDDPYIWLEEVQGEKALSWAKAENAKTLPALEAKPQFKAIHEKLLAVYNSRERIPNVSKRGAWYYNYWQDAANPRGILRRTTLEEFRKAEPKWDLVLDVGKLSDEEKEKWVYKGSSCLYPDYNRCLISLSRAGADAVVVREFDIAKKEFVKGGFEMVESKGYFAWKDADTLYVARDFGPGTLTKSGYPRQIKVWKRGTPMADAKLLFEGIENDVSVWPIVDNEKGRTYERYSRHVDFFNSEEYIKQGDRWVRLATPSDSALTTANGLLFVRLKAEWKPAATAFKSGSLIAIDLDKFLAGGRDFELVFEPGARVSLQSYTVTKNLVVLDILDNVKGRVSEARREGGKWVLRDVPVPPAASVGVSAVERDDGDDYWMTVTSFLEPTTLYYAKGGTAQREKLKSLPSFYDAKGLKVVQYEATSKDGTKIPYFLVMREDAKLDGTNPTILYGYGGFEISMTPSYSGTIGSAWLEKGGVWALANIRGGGEFGPQWHKTAQREGRAKTHDDFIAVAEDLITRKVTTPRHLGIMGGSQGGLLVGSAFTQRPELFRAVSCQVPLLDMKRYNKLLAGASWQGEYGNPDVPADWEFISTYSPYQKVKRGTAYPKVFFYTSTRDDRVHPGHARKMVARMQEQGHDVLYYEYMEGGHAAGTNPTQQAYTWALTYTFFWDQLR
ncbi:prolyl oligopeptidase family serine peptidase [Usitatibacter palustris]|uniref:Prolyl endopeptidase n=1 Tax=Usitatibacter palustris TaxID=2732487 RepID=A0A6M4H4U9_9PROT|nr:prolyl oligopeptidase family serine peptidase [Usitatibacter palustris]QJR14302.1 Prolyl endopeptidase [Usitatibacter palustris]